MWRTSIYADTFSLEMFGIAYVMAKHAMPIFGYARRMVRWIIRSQSIRFFHNSLSSGVKRSDGCSAKNFVQQISSMTTPLFLLRCVQMGISIHIRTWLPFSRSWMICMLKTATMIIKDIWKWRLRRTSTNFNELVALEYEQFVKYWFCIALSRQMDVIELEKFERGVYYGNKISKFIRTHWARCKEQAEGILAALEFLHPMQ